MIRRTRGGPGREVGQRVGRAHADSPLPGLSCPIDHSLLTDQGASEMHSDPYSLSVLGL